MDYKQALRQQMEEYYEITAQYRTVTVDAMSDARKKSMFKKIDFSFHISGFRQLAVKAEKINPEQIEIPEDDLKSKELAELLNHSITSFILLCEANIQYYDVIDRKQYRSNKVPLKEYADAANRMQGVLEGAVKELEKLEQAYKEYSADNFADK